MFRLTKWLLMMLVRFIMWVCGCIIRQFKASKLTSTTLLDIEKMAEGIYAHTADDLRGHFPRSVESFPSDGLGVKSPALMIINRRRTNYWLRLDGKHMITIAPRRLFGLGRIRTKKFGELTQLEASAVQVGLHDYTTRLALVGS